MIEIDLCQKETFSNYSRGGGGAIQYTKNCKKDVSFYQKMPKRVALTKKCKKDGSFDQKMQKTPSL